MFQCFDIAEQANETTTIAATQGSTRDIAMRGPFPAVTAVDGLRQVRRHTRSHRPPVFAVIAGMRYRMRDISYGGFAMDGWLGVSKAVAPLAGEIVAGEIVADDLDEATGGGRIPFEARLLRAEPKSGTIAAEFVSINDNDFDRLMALLAAAATTQAYVAELEANGRFPPALLHMLRRVPPSVLRSFSRRQIDAMIDGFPVVAPARSYNAAEGWGVPPLGFASGLRHVTTPAARFSLGLLKAVALAVVAFATMYVAILAVSTAGTLAINLLT